MRCAESEFIRIGSSRAAGYRGGWVFEGAGSGTIAGFAVSEFQVRNMAVEMAGGVGGGFYWVADR